MQPIHRTSYQDAVAPPSGCLADHLATLIDGQARTGLAATGASAGLEQTDRPDANALIWVEDTPGMATARSRGLIVVAHSMGQTAAERSCVISYPAGAADEQDILAVSEKLTAMGWLLLSCLCRETARGHASVAVLVNRSLPGNEQQLWLAAPSAALLAYPAGSGTAANAALGTRDQVEAWVNEGGAGDDVTK